MSNSEHPGWVLMEEKGGGPPPGAVGTNHPPKKAKDPGRHLSRCLATWQPPLLARRGHCSPSCPSRDKPLLKQIKLPMVTRQLTPNPW